MTPRQRRGQRGADDKGHALGDRLALGAVVGLPDDGCQRVGQLVDKHV